MQQRAGRPGAGKRSRHRAGAAPGARLRPPRATRTSAAMRRLLTPVAKFWICKRGSHFAQEAMECLGGNGYVEEDGEGMMARIYREMPLNSIWEGAGNIMALDLLRALRRGDVAAALAHELRRRTRRAPGARPRRRRACPRRSSTVATEAQARRLAQDVALALQAALLQQQRRRPCSTPSAPRACGAAATPSARWPPAPTSTPSSQRAMPTLKPRHGDDDDRPDPAPLRRPRRSPRRCG